MSTPDRPPTRGEAAPPPDEDASAMDLADLRTRLEFIARRAWQETRQTARVTAAQFQRLAVYLRGSWARWRLDRRYLRARESLGRAMAKADLGDPSLRKRAEDLNDRRTSLLAARASTKAVDAELRGVYVRLAEPLLESVQAPPAVEEEHRQALALRLEMDDRSARQAQRRSALFPKDRETRIRTAAGMGALVLVCLLVVGAMSDGDDIDELLLSPEVEFVVLEPALTIAAVEDGGDGKAAAAKETREIELAAGEYFPERKAIVPLVNGRPHGEVRFEDSEGRLICLEYYRNGVLNGTRKCYYPSGRKFNELHFVNGKAQGSNTTWFENGNKAADIDMLDGAPHGRAILYFEDGRKCIETTYVLGKPHGPRYHYRADGIACFAIVEWQDGSSGPRQILLEPTEADHDATESRAEFSLRLKDHW